MVNPKKTVHDFQMSNFVKRCSREKQQLKTKVSRQLASDIQRLFDEGSHADLQVSVFGDVIPVHICLLKQRAPWLYEWMGCPGPGSTKASEDVRPNILRKILRSLYSEDDVSGLRQVLERDLECSVANGTEKTEDSSIATALPGPACDGRNTESPDTPGSAVTPGSVTTPGSEDSGSWDVHCRMSSSEGVPEETGPPEPCSQLGRSLLEMFQSQADTDVVIEVKDATFQAHRCVLCARCEYFSAMLAGGWRESGSQHIKIQGVSALTLHQCLLYIYGGVSTLLPDIQIPELISAADMYGLEGMREITASILRMDYCHFFHKPCEGCLTGVPDTLQLTHTFGPADLNQQCRNWTTKHMLRVWPTKRFASLPPDVLTTCRATAISEVNITNALEMAMTCDKVMDSLPHVKWSQAISPMLTALRETCIKDISDRMAPMIASFHFRHLANTMAMGLGVMEEVLCEAVDALPPDKACDAYVAWDNMQQSIGSELCDWTEAFQELVQNLFQRCKHYMSVHTNQVVGTAAWVKLPAETQNKIREGAGFVAVGDLTTKRAAPPKLTPRGPNSSSGKKAAASNPAKTQAKSATQLHSKSSRKPVNNLPSRAGSAAASHRPTTSSSAKKPANNSPLRLRQNNATKSGASGSSSQSTSSASAIPGPSHTSSPLRRADSPSAMLIRKQSADAMSNSSLSEGMLGDTTFGSSTTLDDDSVSMCSCRAVKGSFSVPVSDIESEGWPEALLMDDSMGGSQSSPGDPQHECESADDYINWELTAPIHFMPDVLLPVWSVQFLAEV